MLIIDNHTSVCPNLFALGIHVLHLIYNILSCKKTICFDFLLVCIIFENKNSLYRSRGVRYSGKPYRQNYIPTIFENIDKAFFENKILDFSCICNEILILIVDMFAKYQYSYRHKRLE